MNFRDVELLSAYLDGRLTPSDAARLEARLLSDANLKATLEDLRQTRAVLRRLPQRKAPRNFQLTPKMVGIRPPEPRAYPAFRMATALAAVLFLASVALNAVTPFAARRLTAAPAPAFGMGGGGMGGGAGEVTESAPAATQAPLQAPFAAQALTPTPQLKASDAATSEALQTQEASRVLPPPPSGEESQTGPIRGGSPLSTGQPVPVPLIIIFGLVMIVCAVAAWLLRANNERRVRERWKQK